MAFAIVVMEVTRLVVVTSDLLPPSSRYVSIFS
jgi:hypothetical protein